MTPTTMPEVETLLPRYGELGRLVMMSWIETEVWARPTEATRARERKDRVVRMNCFKAQLVSAHSSAMTV